MMKRAEILHVVEEKESQICGCVSTLAGWKRAHYNERKNSNTVVVRKGMCVFTATARPMKGP
jgi:hypothetical protein